MSKKEHQTICGDCLEILRAMPAASVDSIVTDPPYGLSFMGKKWDYDVPSEDIWRECLRVLKPGGHLLAFAGTRTQHRMAVNIEDAGFEIRDMIAWVYGSGFPKSHNLKDQWQGWGTALKPALEPITVARKPLIGTVAENVMAHGTGAINVDECRVGDNAGWSYPNGRGGSGWHGRDSLANNLTEPMAATQGRWPANLIHDGSEEVIGLFPVTAPSRANKVSDNRAAPFYQAGDSITGGVSGRRDPNNSHDDAGGSAARFFYCAKASKADRDEGCEGLEERASSSMSGRRDCDDVDWKADNDVTSRFVTQRRNHHPTVKPTALMRYLCRLVTPPSGIVLDPFMGSGSTGKAAMLEGFQFIGIEREAEYVEIAKARIAAEETKRGEMLPLEVNE